MKTDFKTGLVFKQRDSRSGSLISTAIFILAILLVSPALYGIVKEHPRVLLQQADVRRITDKILLYEDVRKDFQLFLTAKTYIEAPMEFAATTQHLHRILNKIMKNSFLYMLGRHDSRLLTLNYYGDDPNRYMRNIEAELLFLINPETILNIQQLGQLQMPGYAAKSLALAYDWGYDYFAGNGRLKHRDFEIALKVWGDWFTSPGRYYGSVFSNHAPWGAKSIAYIAAALGDENLFWGEETKTQKSIIPHGSFDILSAQVNISAKGFFDQVLHAVSFVAHPRGGWHESVSYYLGKELPELLEFAEIVCTYHNDVNYTNSVYTSPLFKHAGSFLYQMTTPDGMLQKIGDTGAKTALPAEKYEAGGNTYGDINDVGAGYLAGYFLERLYHRLLNASEIESARLLKSYIDTFCFDFPTRPFEESNINMLYAFMWRAPDAWAPPVQETLNNALLPYSVYFDNVGILISKSADVLNQSGTIVRFDAQPFYFSGHQHFAAGNFTIFKGASLAIDGGRYTSINTPDTKSYYEKVYRHALSHNVMLFGDSLTGQKAFPNQPDHAPYTEQQLNPFQEYGTGPQNISIFQAEQYKGSWDSPWHVNGMRIQLAKLYDHIGVDSYFRMMLHFYLPENQMLPWSDFVVIYDTIIMQQANTSQWQMHFRDNGASFFDGDSVFVIVRDESIDRRLVKAQFGSRYKGQLFIKAMNPAATPSLCTFDFPDTICQNCWNGRIWEESTHILRYTTPENQQHDYVNLLAPTLFPHVTKAHTRNFSQNVQEFAVSNRFFKSIVLNFAENKTGVLYMSIANPHVSDLHEILLQTDEILPGWFFIIGVQPGTWRVRLLSANGTVALAQTIASFDSKPVARWGLLAFHLDEKLASGQTWSVSLFRL